MGFKSPSDVFCTVPVFSNQFLNAFSLHIGFSYLAVGTAFDNAATEKRSVQLNRCWGLVSRTVVPVVWLTALTLRISHLGLTHVLSHYTV